jgi:serine/threonine protein kinase/ketosteroid isomerase-like protein
MKLCPACQRCYDDTDAVCSYDSKTLVPSRHGSRTIADKYRLDRLLGRGGMGAVYAGTHVDLDRLVAIKLLLPDFTADQEALERFRREARAAARLNHPNVADTYDYGSLPEGGAYIVMELIDGMTLREHMDAVGQLPFDEAIQIARQVTSGVEAAHRSDITHRDLKPSNIILARDHEGHMLAKVVDFSVAKLKEGTTSGTALTATGSLIGTPRYMAPEQCADNKTDARSDIYSLGVILYEMLAGRAPFEGPTTTAIAIKHIQTPPPPVEEFRPDTPASLRNLIKQSLAKSPSERPQTAQEFATRLDEAARELPPSAPGAQPLAAPEKNGGLAAEDGRGAVTNPQKPANDSNTGRTGEPTREEEIGHEESGNNPPSVQSYAVSLGEQDEELETKVSSKEAAQVPPQGVSENIETKKKEVGAETTRTASAQTESATNAEGSFPLLSEHSRKAGGAQEETIASPVSPRSVPPTAEAATARHSNYTAYAMAAALVVIVGLGIYLLAFRRTATRTSAENQTASTANSNETGAGAANRADSNKTNNQPALSDSNAAPSSTPAAPRDARAELQSLTADWVNATVSRDINKIISFYPPVMDTFYLKRNVPRAAVRDEKQRMIAQASSIELQTSQPEINVSNDGRNATMTFRKSWNFRGAQNSSGEVVQELRWVKTGEGWKIVSERDIGVIR